MGRATRPGSVCAITACLVRRVMAPEACGPSIRGCGAQRSTPAPQLAKGAFEAYGKSVAKKSFARCRLCLSLHTWCFNHPSIYPPRNFMQLRRSRTGRSCATSAQRWGFGANRKSVAGSLGKQQLLSTAEWHCHNTTTGWVIVASRRRGASLRALHQGSYIRPGRTSSRVHVVQIG